uniref:Uncharacterized protein n=1 Tax=Helianthus annuus TaxID=4232 RepID=A0A251VDI5_HELAN
MGPYVIRRVGRFGDVDIEDVQTNKQQTVNRHRLKPYLESNDINNLELDKVGYILRPKLKVVRIQDMDLLSGSAGVVMDRGF